MRVGMGVVAGLVIGAALSFSALAVVSLVGGTEDICGEDAPTGWLIRAEVPWGGVSREVSSVAVPLAGGRLRLREVGPGECGSILVWADWIGGMRLPRLGLELEARQGAADLRPAGVLFGQLRLPLSWLPEPWRERIGVPLAQAGQAVLTRQLQGEGMSLCGLRGESSGLAVYLCRDGD
ncbi:MAG: hypothetical protein HPY83_06150 [Anaerolineae bacterium]|nr:hypothetical protein [Anaerolineae bacterium]